PGIVAAAGGLLLIGLGAGLRTLQRIERALATRPMPRAHAVAEGANVAESVEPPRGPAIPFAPKIGYEAQPGLASRAVLADKSPAAPGANKISPPIPAPATAAVADANVETVGQPSGKKNGNGAAGVPLRLSATLQRPSAGDRQSEPAFEALWPKGPRPSRALDGALIAQSTGATPIHSQQSTDTHPMRRYLRAIRAAARHRCSSRALSTVCRIHSIPMARSKHSCRRARSVSVRSPNCAITS